MVPFLMANLPTFNSGVVDAFCESGSEEEDDAPVCGLGTFAAVGSLEAFVSFAPRVETFHFPLVPWMRFTVGWLIVNDSMFSFLDVISGHNSTPITIDFAVRNGSLP